MKQSVINSNIYTQSGKKLKMQNANRLLQCDIKPFYSCNLACRFCHEKYKRSLSGNNDITLNGLIEYFDRTYNIIKTVVQHRKYNTLDASFMGGELFQDRFSDEFVEQYSLFFQLCRA